MPRKFLRCVIGCGLFLTVIVGCGKQEASSSASATDPKPPPSVISIARARYSEGDVEGAIAALDAGLNDDTVVEQHPFLFHALIQLMVMEARTDEAQDRFVTAATNHPEVAGAALGTIAQHLARQEDLALLLQWSQRIMTFGFKGEHAARAHLIRLSALIQGEQWPAVVVLGSQAPASLDSDSAARVSGHAIRQLIQLSRLDDAERIINALREVTPSTPPLATLVMAMDISVLAAKGQWDSAVKSFERVAQQLGDRQARASLEDLLMRARKSDTAPNLTERLCLFCISKLSDAPVTRRYAITTFVNGVKRDDGDGMVARIRRAGEAGATPPEIAPQVSRNLFSIMKTASPDSQRALLDILETCICTMGPEGDDLQGILMDGAIMSDDYARALRILEDGFRADDPEWHAMAINKVRAHIALEAGLTDEAIERFERFMKHVATWTEATVDPSTGLRHTRAMNLGFNAKRIGDILTQAERTTEAMTYYTQARTHFEAALTSVEPDSKEHTFIKEQTAAIPAAP